MTLLALFAFLAGIVTILSPCILPVLPIVLSGSVGGKRKPLGVVTGFIASFSAFTLLLSALVQTLSIPADALRVVAVIIIITFGLTLAVPRLHTFLEGILSRVVKTGKTQNRNGFAGGILTGMSLGLVWTPCVGPIMASVITLAVSQQIDGGAVLIIASYSLGTSIPMFALMVGGRKLLSRFPRLTSRTAGIQRVFGIIMIAAALMIAVGADRRFQTAVLDLFPQYGAGLTAFESSEPVRKALDEWRGKSSDQESSTESPFTWENRPQGAQLSDFGAAPSLIAKGPWINTEVPLDMDSLRGKVVLVDFWTYSCINCVRTIPHLQQWYERYSEEGFVIIGVHSPEFPFERNINNVKKAVEDLGVPWPVVLDNDFSQWHAYNNRYWPAHFFIDAEGRVRYFQFGEGSYGEAEDVIRQLLREAGRSISVRRSSEADLLKYSPRTPEIYLGYTRLEGFLSTSVMDEESEYTHRQPEEPGTWSLSGSWTFRNDFIELDGSGTLSLAFEGRDIFMVIEPEETGSALSILIDGRKGADTEDVQEGVLKPDTSRLYHLASFDEAGEHLISIQVEGHVRFYTFTFG